jgi:hypothetical protein
MRLPVAAKIALPLAAFLSPHHRRVAHGGGGDFSEERLNQVKPRLL